MSAFLSPIFGASAQLFTNSGVPLAGGKVYTYVAGTTTPAATYVDNSQGVVNANPIILDSSGRFPQEVWLQGGSVYKFVVTDSLGNPVGQTWDNISGVNDAAYPQASVSEWVTGSSPTYTGTTTFTVAGDQTATYQANRRVKASVTAGLAYGSITGSVFGAGVTTVTVVNDSTPLDSGLSIIQYSLLTPSPTSLPLTVLSATTIQNQTPVAVTTGGTSTAFTVAPSPVFTALTANQALDVTFNTTCGNSPTLNINALGALALVKMKADGTYTALVAGDTVSGWRSQVVILTGATQILVRQVIGNTVPAISPTFTGTMAAANGTFSGTLGVTGVATFTAQPIASSLTASLPVFTDGSKGLVSNAMTGTGNVVMSASPTMTGTAAHANGTFSGTLGVTGVATFTAQPIVSSLTASQAVFSDGSKGLVSNAVTGTGSVVMSAGSTLTGDMTIGNNNLKTIKTASFNGEVTSASTSGTVNLDFTTGQNFKQTELTGAITYTFTAPPGPCHMQIRGISDGVSTSYSITLPAGTWYGAAFTASTANKKWLVNIWYDGAAYHYTGMSEI